MKVIDKNGKLFGKISLLDIIIVAVIVFLVGIFVAGRFGQVKLPIETKSNTEYVVKLKAYNVEKTEKFPFEVGSVIYGKTGEFIGTVTEVERKPMVTKEKLEDGTYFDYESQTAYDYFLTVEGTGTSTEKGIFAQGTFALYPNNSVTVTSKYIYGGVVVLSVEKKV